MDNLIIATRGKGKTLRLINKCSNDKFSVIVCPDKKMCICVYKMAEELGMKIPMPITFEQFVTNNWYEDVIENFYFDELQMSLRKIAGRVNISDVVIDVSNSSVENLV